MDCNRDLITFQCARQCAEALLKLRDEERWRDARLFCEENGLFAQHWTNTEREEELHRLADTLPGDAGAMLRRFANDVLQLRSKHARELAQ